MNQDSKKIRKILFTFLLFLLAGLCEIGGGYLVWLWLREDMSWILGGRGLILAITTPRSLKVRDKKIYVQSERNPSIRYRVDFEDGTYTCSDFIKRGETCKHFYKVVMERAIA